MTATALPRPLAARETFRYHWLRLRAVAHPTEDVERVRRAVAFVAGAQAAPAAQPESSGSLPSGSDPVVDTQMETHHGLTSHVLEATLEKSRPLRDVLGRVLAVPGARARLLATLEARTDDDGVLYVRLDKQAAYQGRLELTQGEDCVQLRLKVEAYPSGREAALATLGRMLEAERP
ncbi:MAG TPA: RNA-binding domain-containing protein [Candidatus Thermoplasmatota archaeon]|nr:RNA-binding domain-containing protein [Candidatus Thermoplasmatota archaeon]